MEYETMMAFVDYWNNNTLDSYRLTNEEISIQLSSVKEIGK